MKKKPNECPGGIEHPLREGVFCWGNHNEKTEGHWAYITVKGALQRVSWRVNT